MGWFETVAVWDLRVRVVLAVAVLVFVAVGGALTVLLASASGFAVGAVAAVPAAVYTARRLG